MNQLKESLSIIVVGFAVLFWLLALLMMPVPAISLAAIILGLIGMNAAFKFVLARDLKK